MTREDYLHLRDEIHKEHTLLNQRISWLITSQSFLFMPLAIGIEKSYGARIEDSIFYPFIPILGILICFTAFGGVCAAVWRAAKLRAKQFEIDSKSGYFTQHSIGHNLENRIVQILGFTPAVLIPLFLSGGWLWLL